jgi:hypothetical protein
VPPGGREQGISGLSASFHQHRGRNEIILAATWLMDFTQGLDRLDEQPNEVIDIPKLSPFIVLYQRAPQRGSPKAAVNYRQPLSFCA